MTEIDIEGIDKKVRDLWKKNKDSILEIDKEITELQKLLTKHELASYIKKDIEEKVRVLVEKKTALHDSYQNLNYYTIEYIELIESVKNQAPKKISFMEKRFDTVNDTIEKYKKILKKYNMEKFITVTNDQQKKSPKQKCINKDCKSKDFIYNSELNANICTLCGIQKEIVENVVNYKDNTRATLNSKYFYERKVHFKDTMNQLQGKQNCTINEQVYKDINKQLEIYNLLQGDASTPKQIRYEKVTKKHILLFLKETKNTKHYEDSILIYHNITGKPIDNISHLENSLLEDFDLISDAYDKLYKYTGKVDRLSFINVQFVLLELLIKYKYKVDKSDFNQLTTLDRRLFHDTVLGDIFNYLGWTYVSLF